MIQLQGVSFGYRKHRLYEDFSLRLEAPGVYGVFGRNGSGKSTLLKLLAGLLFPCKGRIDVLGYSPARRDPAFLGDVYIVPEEFHLPDLSPEHLARTHAPFYPAFDREAFTEYLDTFEVPVRDAFEQMSLGQKKKAAIAFALASRTRVLLLDEPTNGLDILGRDQFKRLMARPEQQARITLISTHQAHDLERIMGHMVFIDSARLALSATVPQLARALCMGVVDTGELSSVANVVYHEPFGEQLAYVAQRPPGAASTPVQLELLYKALSSNRPGVLDALAATEVANV